RSYAARADRRRQHQRQRSASKRFVAARLQTWKRRRFARRLNARRQHPRHYERSRLAMTNEAAGGEMVGALAVLMIFGMPIVYLIVNRYYGHQERIEMIRRG